MPEPWSVLQLLLIQLLIEFCEPRQHRKMEGVLFVQSELLQGVMGQKT